MVHPSLTSPETIGFGHIGLGHLGWFNNYHTYQHHGGRSYRYVIYKSNKCYDEDWCGHSRKICFDEHYDEVRGVGCIASG
jgi:hypothetical protein